MPRLRLSRLRARLTHLAGVGLVLFAFFLGLGSIGTYGTIAYTSRSQFCSSCHIMEPFYASWENSPHANVECIECHFEPGAVETFDGKFKALTQLAKYVTRTAGTKPWAEVADASCLRSGCHSLPALEGEIAFGSVRFDHRPHLMDAGHGGRLRCVSCHGQVTVDEHMAVPQSVCFACHFMEGGHAGGTRSTTAECTLCHTAPHGPLQVAGAAFDHGEYVARGVACQTCHTGVIEGEGRVARERCLSCHAEPALIARMGEAASMHRIHVTDTKIECFQCHDEIRHGMKPLELPKATAQEGCGSCHSDPHQAPSLLYAGKGAAGVPDQPSRMFETHVACTACHTGRTGHRQVATGAASRASAHPPVHGSRVALAGEADCLHCHGTGYQGMLGEWQEVVGEQLERLRPLLERASEALPEDAAPAQRRRLDEARQNLLLVASDGSRGVHNPAYALDALRAGAERLDALLAELEPGSAPAAAAGFPFRSTQGCSQCHLGVERRELEVHGRPFSHARHLASEGTDCGSCHSIADHGKPSFPRDQCASCHHQEERGFDPSDCASCHSSQVSFFQGRTHGFEGEPDPMAEMDCSDCHGEAPAILRPKPALCVLCHEPGYDTLLIDGQKSVAELLTHVEQALRAGGALPPELKERAGRAVQAVRADGSLGAHNPKLAEGILGEILEQLRSR